MGPKQSQANQLSEDKLNKNHFEFLHVVGKGGFGKVWKVLLKKNKRPFALKEMSKVKIIDRKSERSIMYERELLARLKHPFIVNMQYAFQDYDNLYLVMDLLTGGDLRYHISRHKRFSEEQTRFFVACITLGLEYVHGNKVIHRDIKPENLVLDERGYVRITDFGVAKVYQKENSSETSGTPGYMAPEVMCAQNHSYFVDYFAVGVMAFEFMYGVRPYLGKSRKEIKELILAKQVQIKPGDIPDGWSIEAADFINKMLQRKPANRLGYNGICEIKDHPWLKYYPWRDLYEKKLEAPFVPKNMDNYDKKYCEGPDKIGNDTLERYQNYYKNEALNEIFINYSFENLLSLPAAPKESSKNNNNNNYSSKKAKSGMNSSNQSNSQGQSQSPQKKRIDSSIGSLAANSKNASLNNLLKNKMKITESLYLNQPNNYNNNSNVSNFNINNNNNNNRGNYISVNQSQGYMSKATPVKNRTNSLNMNSTNMKQSNILSPNHVRNLSSNSNLSVAFNYKQNNQINNDNSNNSNNNNNNNTPNKNRSFNNLNLLKSRVKNLSINSSANISNLTNIPASNVSVNKTNSKNNANLNINPASSVILNPKQSSATPFRKAQIADKTGSERLPFIEQKLANFRQFSSNVAVAKKISNSPSLKNSAKSAAANGNNINNNGNLQQKSNGAGKYTTLSASANSTGSSTVSVNFLHKRSGSTNTFNNY